LNYKTISTTAVLEELLYPREPIVHHWIFEWENFDRRTPNRLPFAIYISAHNIYFWPEFLKPKKIYISAGNIFFPENKKSKIQFAFAVGIHIAWVCQIYFELLIYTVYPIAKTVLDAAIVHWMLL
jgi:hypothetical protein